MASVEDHYSNLLAPIYLWMAGGIDAALAQGAGDVSKYVPARTDENVAIDLGAGFGMHSIPLARSGYTVAAIDSSPALLAELRKYSEGLSVRAVESDLLHFRSHVSAPANLVLCMGDTITHVQDQTSVERLFLDVANALAPAGRFIVTFRDYTNPPSGEARFIPVRSDADRIHTCFLEETPQYMVVHDLLHERRGTSWSMRVSSYRKLRLSPDWITAALERAGLSAKLESGPRGMLRVTATAA
jgi:SAM-dependent methyltransferase